MKKYIIIALTALAALAISCNKQAEPEQNVPQDNTFSMVKSFKVVMPETRAVLGDNSESGKKFVQFSDSDEITIFASTSGNAYTGTYDEANGEFTTEITEAADAEETVFYAVYPKQVNTGSKLYDWSFSAGSISTSQNFKLDLNAVEGGFDEEVAVMTALTDEEGTLAFRYGTAFFKLGIAMDNVAQLTLSIPEGNGRLSGKPVYNADGTLNKLNNTKRTITVSGSFVNGGTYYIPFFTNGSKVGGPFELTFTLSDESSATLSTEAFTNVTFAPGIIYNIGAPVVSFAPVITASNPDALEYDATEGSVAYTVSDGGTLTGATAEEYTETGYDALTLSNIEITSTEVTFECDENEGENPRMCKLVLSYTGAEDVEVVIKQKASGEHTDTNTYIFYVDGSGKQVQTCNGAEGSYFSLTGTSTLLCASTGSKPYFGVDSYTIEGSSYNYAKKIDSSNGLSFTTAADGESTIVYYCASRNTGATATMKLNEGSTAVVTSSLTWTDGKADLIKVEKVLTPGKTYSFAKSGEVGLFYVIVTETITN